MSYLFDTNILSELVSKKPNQTVLDFIDSLPQEDIYISVITLGEIHRGIEKLPASKRRTQLEAWFRNELVPLFNTRIIRLGFGEILTWGSMVAEAEKRGKSISAFDSLIACTAKHHNLILVTRNTKDFQHVDIQLINPWELA